MQFKCEASNPAGCVYFLRHKYAPIVKIGWTKSPENRFTQGYELCYVTALLHGDRDEEHRLHLKFKDHHLEGEWFEWEPVGDWLSSLALPCPFCEGSTELQPTVQVPPDLWTSIRQMIENFANYKQVAHAVRRLQMHLALQVTCGNQSAAARLIGIGYLSFTQLTRKYQLNPDDYGRKNHPDRKISRHRRLRDREGTMGC